MLRLSTSRGGDESADDGVGTLSMTGLVLESMLARGDAEPFSRGDLSPARALLISFEVWDDCFRLPQKERSPPLTLPFFSAGFDSSFAVAASCLLASASSLASTLLLTDCSQAAEYLAENMCDIGLDCAIIVFLDNFNPFAIFFAVLDLENCTVGRTAASRSKYLSELAL